MTRDLEFLEVAANPGLSELLGSGILAYRSSLAQAWGAEISPRQPGPPLGASSSAPTRPDSSGIFFSFPLEIGFGVSPALSPPPRNSSPLFFLLLLLPETWPGQWLLEEEQVWEKGEEIGAK